MRRWTKTGVVMLTLMALLVIAWPMAALGHAPQSDVDIGETWPLRYQHIDFLTATLTINSSGYATCTAKVKGKEAGHTVKLSMQLQKYSNADEEWEPCYTWPTLTGSGATGVNTTKNRYVTRGKYRVEATGSVYNSSGTLLETDTAYSAEKTYR